jgi:hypothetical protein
MPSNRISRDYALALTSEVKPPGQTSHSAVRFSENALANVSELFLTMPRISSETLDNLGCSQLDYQVPMRIRRV